MPHVESMEKRIPAEEGSIATLRCLVRGHPEPRVLWYRDRKLREPLKKGVDYDLNMKPFREVKNNETFSKHFKISAKASYLFKRLKLIEIFLKKIKKKKSKFIKLMKCTDY